MITGEKALDILDRMDFFQGQRAGRELWNDKPYEVQEEDIKGFSRDVAELKAYIADVVPKSEVDEIVRQWKEEANCWQNNYITELRDDEQIKSEVAREIFAEIEKALNLSKCYGESGIYFEHDIETDIAKLKKKYTEETE